LTCGLCLGLAACGGSPESGPGHLCPRPMSHSPQTKKQVCGRSSPPESVRPSRFPALPTGSDPRRRLLERRGWPPMASAPRTSPSKMTMIQHAGYEDRRPADAHRLRAETSRSISPPRPLLLDPSTTRAPTSWDRRRRHPAQAALQTPVMFVDVGRVGRRRLRIPHVARAHDHAGTAGAGQLQLHSGQGPHAESHYGPGPDDYGTVSTPTSSRARDFDGWARTASISDIAWGQTTLRRSHLRLPAARLRSPRTASYGQGTAPNDPPRSPTISSAGSRTATTPSFTQDVNARAPRGERRAAGPNPGHPRDPPEVELYEMHALRQALESWWRPPCQAAGVRRVAHGRLARRRLLDHAPPSAWRAPPSCSAGPATRKPVEPRQAGAELRSREARRRKRHAASAVDSPQVRASRGATEQGGGSRAGPARPARRAWRSFVSRCHRRARAPA